MTRRENLRRWGGVFVGGALLLASPIAAQEDGGFISMKERIAQVLRVLEQGESCAAAGAALDNLPGTLWGGLRPLRTRGKDGKPDPTTVDVHNALSGAERGVAQALDRFANSGRCPDQAGRAFDLKLLVEEINEVAEAVGRITERCGEGDSLQEEPCDQLVPLLDEDNGAVRTVRQAQAVASVIKAGWAVKLRSPIVPTWFSHWEEDIRVTDPIAPGHCVVVFKETRGLMLRLVLDRIIIVTDPWVSVFGQPRGTRIPVWRLEFVPSEHVKEWNICNSDGYIKKSVTQRVVQDSGLNFFWKFYPRNTYH